MHHVQKSNWMCIDKKPQDTCKAKTKDLGICCQCVKNVALLKVARWKLNVLDRFWVIAIEGALKNTMLCC
jgi:hypothetical protein